MRCNQFNFYIKDNLTAVGKARLDISYILKNLGINSIYEESSRRIVRLYRQISALCNLHKTDVLFVQYPAGRREFIILARKIYREKLKIVAYIHDLNSVREHISVEKELNFLNHFDILISHNQNMTEYLRQIGYVRPVIDLEIFDYVHDQNRKVTENKLESSVCFAGNLNKSLFLQHTEKIKNLKFELYGICDNFRICNASNVLYHGSAPADEIPYILSGAFGLVWDGDSIESCSGDLGQYLIYNNPHKLSLYIAAGKPVIVWKHSGTAAFVEKTGIGIAVESISEAADIINRMTEAEYKSFQDKVSMIKKQLSVGFYTGKAAKNAMQII